MKLEECRVGILGLGQIGASLGAALKKRRLAAEVYGVARREEVRRQAVDVGACDVTSEDPVILAGCDIVVLATPVRHIIEVIPQIASGVKQGALLMDVGGTKEKVVETALATPPTFSFVGGHPMAGTEKAGVGACNPDLFVDRSFLLVPARILSLQASEWAGGLATGVGARAIWMDSARNHDLAVAAISQLPHVLAYAVRGLTSELSAQGFGRAEFLASIAAGSYRDATRVAASNKEMILDYLLTNPDHLPGVLERCTALIDQVRQAIASGDEDQLRALLK